MFALDQANSTPECPHILPLSSDVYEITYLAAGYSFVAYIDSFGFDISNGQI